MSKEIRIAKAIAITIYGLTASVVIYSWLGTRLWTLCLVMILTYAFSRLINVYD